MSEPGKAVFLSYASQDAEAAKRICEALRAAGVEVWFDTDGGLEHGDEWDAKIRRQIKECVLFLPIISANTQAREEGYFRIEWELAAERAMGIASGVAFILPIVIDNTREPDALVPDRFRKVQWTRLPGGTVPPDVKARFLKLWSHRTGVLSHEAARATGSEPVQTLQPKSRAGLYPVAVLALALVAGAGWWLLHRPATLTATEATKVLAPVSEAKQLVAKAWEQMNKPKLARAVLETADGFCKRAAELDANDAEVWAAWSQVDSWFVYHNFDRSPARREGARTKASRAMQLAPDSYEARLAQACQLVRAGGGQTASLFDAQAESLLRALLRDNQEEPRALLALGILLRNSGKFAEAREIFGRLVKNPAFATQGWNELGWAERFAGDNRAAEAAIDTSIALQPYWGNLGLKTIIAQTWWGDLDLAKATLDRTSASDRQEDRGIIFSNYLYYWRREPEAMLQVLSSVPRDWLQMNGFDGPKAYRTALAHRMAGHGEAAKIQWQTALKLVERRLADSPDSSQLIHWKGVLLAESGNRPEAETALRLAQEMGNTGSSNLSADDEILLGNLDAAIALLERQVDERARGMTAADFRLNPVYDPLRKEPRFQALLARMEADPKFSPKAKAVPAPSSLSPSPPEQPKIDQKSVAVLAFANLSDDKGNEYFSDGISEELLNVLAKIPGLKVSARTSAFYFKGKEVPIPEIAQKLGVAYVVEGSVRKAGDKVRITAQLIKAEGGFHVWSDSFTRDLKDIFAVQDEIAGLIAQQLQLKLGGSSRAMKQVNPEAYRLVLEGRNFWLLRTGDGFARAEAAFNKALALDPAFAEAHAGLADVWSIRAWYRLLGGESDASDDLNRGDAEAQIALRLDPALAEPYAALGAVRYNQRRYAESEQYYQEALRLNPNYAFAHHWHAQLRGNIGHLDELMAGMDKAIELDPLAFITLTSHTLFLTFARRYEEAITLSDRALALRSEVFVPLYGNRALLMLVVGRKDEAVAAARTVLNNPQFQPRWWLDANALYVLRRAGFTAEAQADAERIRAALPARSQLHAAILAALGQPHEALELLVANGVSSTSISSLYYSEMWDEVRADPRFPGVIVKLGFESDYRLARETLARMRNEQEAKK